MSTSERRDGGIHLSRRQLLVTGAAGGLSLAALGPGSSIAFGATTPKRGGTLQVGLVGGSAATEQLDPNTSTVSSLDLARHQNVFSKLADFDANGKVFPQLAASFEPNKNATSWTVKLKQGVTWHDGSPLTADDVVYSLQRVLDPANKLDSASGNLTMVDPPRSQRSTRRRSRSASSSRGRTCRRSSASATSRSSRTAPRRSRPRRSSAPARSSSPGWTAGTQTTLKANPNYFESGKPYLETVVLNGIDDPTARLNALLSGQVQAMEFVDPSQIKVLKASSAATPLISSGGGWTPIVMNTKVGPFRDVPRAPGDEAPGRPLQARQGRRAGLRAGRQRPLRDPRPALLQLPGPSQVRPREGEVPAQEGGPQRSQGHARQLAGDARHALVGAALRAVGQGRRRQGDRQEAPGRLVLVGGLRKSAFTHSSWGYRPFFPQWLQSFQAFNKEETNWTNAKANKLVQQAVATVDDAKRTDLAHQAQAIQWKEGGYIIWGFQQRLDGVSKSVQGLKPSPINPLGWYGFKDAWLS